MKSVESNTDVGAPSWTRVEGTLMSTARAVRRAYDRVFAAIDLNLSEATVLAHLADAGPMSQVELARRVGNSRARVGAYIDALETKGALTRNGDPDDRRVWLVDLTPSGRDLWRRSVELDASLRRQLRDGTTSAEREQLDAALRRIEQNVAALLADHAGPTTAGGSARLNRTTRRTRTT